MASEDDACSTAPQPATTTSAPTTPTTMDQPSLQQLLFKGLQNQLVQQARGATSAPSQSLLNHRQTNSAPSPLSSFRGSLHLPTVLAACLREDFGRNELLDDTGALIQDPSSTRPNAEEQKR